MGKQRAGVWSKRPALRVRRSFVIGRPAWLSSASASCNGACARGAWPTRGVVAGCTLASTVAKVVLVEGGDAWVAAFPRCSLGVYVYVITMEAAGRDPDAVARMLGGAAEAQSEFVHDDLTGCVAAHKAALVTNPGDALCSLRRRLGVALSGDGAGRSGLGAGHPRGLARARWRSGAGRRTLGGYRSRR